MQVVWSAWLSTLGHAPSVVDLAQSAPVEHFTDAASSLVEQFMPVSCLTQAVRIAYVTDFLILLVAS